MAPSRGVSARASTWVDRACCSRACIKRDGRVESVHIGGRCQGHGGDLPPRRGGVMQRLPTERGSGGDGRRSRLSTRSRARPRRVVRSAGPGPPGPAVLDRPAHARRPRRRRGGRPGRVRARLSGARRLRHGADPRSAASSVARHDRAQPVPDAVVTAGRRGACPAVAGSRGSGAMRACRSRCRPIGRPHRCRPGPARRTERWASLLATLPPAYRAAVVLRHVDGLTYPELAIALDRPEGTVKAQVHRGLACCARRSSPPNGSNDRS